MLNREFPITIGKVIMIWCVGFTCGAPFMYLLVNLKYGGSIVIPAINFSVMALISGIGLFFLLRRKEGPRD